MSTPKLTPIGRRLTNYAPKSIFEIGDLSISFTYKREDLGIENIQDCYQYFIPSISKDQKVELLNCGQLGITSVLSFIKKKFPDDKITIFKKPYIGTIDAFNFLDVEMTTENSHHLWIDSSNINESEINEELFCREWKSIIIDTSCWHLKDRTLKKIINLTNPDITYFIRSISKLDMNGTEFGSLGSLIYSTKNQDFSSFFKMFYKLYGCAPSICDLDPNMFSSDRFEENIKRCIQIEKNSTYIKNELKLEKDFESLFFEHGKYFNIYFPSRVSSFDDLETKKLNKLLALENLDFKFVKSFGFNFWNLDFYYVEELNQYILRVCTSSTTNKKELISFCKSIEAYTRAI